MKRLWVWVTGTLFGLLTIFGLSFSSHSIPIYTSGAKISSITQNTPLYLEQLGISHSNTLDAMQSQHYSHYSHYSHESHYSHYSHYSSR
jgi:hypothetical protein